MIAIDVTSKVWKKIIDYKHIFLKEYQLINLFICLFIYLFSKQMSILNMDYM
jgi:hypothetical protein